MHSTIMERADMLGGPPRSSKDVDLDEQDAVVSSHLAKLRELASALQTSSGAQMATHLVVRQASAASTACRTQQNSKAEIYMRLQHNSGSSFAPGHGNSSTLLQASHSLTVYANRTEHVLCM
jgi:hypothetical protein